MQEDRFFCVFWDPSAVGSALIPRAAQSNGEYDAREESHYR